MLSNSNVNSDDDQPSTLKVPSLHTYPNKGCNAAWGDRTNSETAPPPLLLQHGFVLRKRFLRFRRGVRRLLRQKGKIIRMGLAIKHEEVHSLVPHPVVIWQNAPIVFTMVPDLSTIVNSMCVNYSPARNFTILSNHVSCRPSFDPPAQFIHDIHLKQTMPSLPSDGLLRQCPAYVQVRCPFGNSLRWWFDLSEMTGRNMRKPWVSSAT